MSEPMSDKKTELREEAQKDAKKNGLFLCPDAELLDDLVAGLATNQERYGYASCPCRVASGIKTYDADIICPCEYRDADCDEFGMCFCGLYVSKKVRENPSALGSIPERRPKEIIDLSLEVKQTHNQKTAEEHPLTPCVKLSKNIPVWRCTVCGYLAARENPPAICPICRAKADRFERFAVGHIE
jgi:ferredoxin-thioredoxin reductase catalytic subunit